MVQNLLSALLSFIIKSFETLRERLELSWFHLGEHVIPKPLDPKLQHNNVMVSIPIELNGSTVVGFGVKLVINSITVACNIIINLCCKAPLGTQTNIQYVGIF